MGDSFKNQYVVEEKQLVSLSIYNVGFQKCEPLHQWGPGTRDHYLIHYIVTGKGYYITDKHQFTLSAGDTFLIYPDEQITYYADENDPWEYYWVGFSGSDAATLLAATDFTPDTPVLHNVPSATRSSSASDSKTAAADASSASDSKAAVDASSASDSKTAADASSASSSQAIRLSLKNHLYRIYLARGNAYVNAVEMTGELYLTLCELIKAAEKQPVNKPFDYSYVQRAIDYISANYSYPITVDEIASYVGISRSQLFREFQRYLDSSPKEYLTDFRIKRACQLLKTSNLSITAIAYSIGYDNSMYFSKVFHKVKGVTPTEYIAKHKRYT